MKPDNFDKSIVRCIVNNFYVSKNKIPSLTKPHSELTNGGSFKGRKNSSQDDGRVELKTKIRLVNRRTANSVE